jgi:hypothetical protein
MAPSFSLMEARKEKPMTLSFFRNTPSQSRKCKTLLLPLMPEELSINNFSSFLFKKKNYFNIFLLSLGTMPALIKTQGLFCQVVLTVKFISGTQHNAHLTAAAAATTATTTTITITEPWNLLLLIKWKPKWEHSVQQGKVWFLWLMKQTTSLFSKFVNRKWKKKKRRRKKTTTRKHKEGRKESCRYHSIFGGSFNLRTFSK